MVTKSQEFESRMNIAEVRLEEKETLTLTDHRDVAKQDLESSAKVLRIQNVPFEKNKVVYATAMDILAPILNCQPQEFTVERDHAYRAHNAYTRRNKLPPEIIVKLTKIYT